MEIFFSSKLKLPNEKTFQRFLQMQANRVMQGHCRYGPPDSAKGYMTRMSRELDAYERTGNKEHLINIAVYCHLEDIAPEHPTPHLDTSVGSVTRKRTLLDDPNAGKNPAAVALGKLGGAKGGKARAEKLSAAKRSAIARKAARARWGA